MNNNANGVECQLRNHDFGQFRAIIQPIRSFMQVSLLAKGRFPTIFVLFRELLSVRLNSCEI